ncbi:MAG: c-type cytochrome [Bacteroidales bacterium]|nr:c-type cytochrome [Bacteroidales bacterium]MCF8402453.1 c-type cytochrome [Bacteroidales bacterium]
MKNIKNIKGHYSLILFAIVLAGIGCKRDNNYTGHAYFPDMAYSNAFETYGSSPNYADSVVMLLPVEGTVPRGYIPYQYTKSFDEQKRAGLELVNPVEKNEENLQRGKEQYTIFCMDCHGERGNGDGHLYTSKLFTAKPTSLRDDYVQNKPDGEIYHVITLGSLSGLMGAHGSQIKPEDRWKIVAYVKNGFEVK